MLFTVPDWVNKGRSCMTIISCIWLTLSASTIHYLASKATVKNATSKYAELIRTATSLRWEAVEFPEFAIYKLKKPTISISEQRSHDLSPVLSLFMACLRPCFNYSLKIVSKMLMLAFYVPKNGAGNRTLNKNQATPEFRSECNRMRYNNLTSCNIFIYRPYTAVRETNNAGAYIYVAVYVYKLCVTYSICFKCQSYQF